MNTFIHSPVNPLLVDIASYNQSLSSRLCLVIFYLPLLTFSILILLFTLINHINHVSHINYFNHVNHVTNFIPRSLNGNQILKKIHPPPTHPLSAFLLLQGADNGGGFGLISAFFLLQGAGD